MYSRLHTKSLELRAFTHGAKCRCFRRGWKYRITRRLPGKLNLRHFSPNKNVHIFSLRAVQKVLFPR